VIYVSCLPRLCCAAIFRVQPFEMGCISSKFVTRSISFHEGKNQSLQRTANVIPVMDELNMYGKGSDHYLALVFTANMVANTVQSEDFKSNTCSEPAIDPFNTRNLIASLDKRMAKQAQPEPKVVGSIDVELTRRSRSCHWFAAHEVSSLALEISDGLKKINLVGVIRV
jgi:hypothetical protein